MKKLALILSAILIPSICFADSLVYVSKTPTVSTTKLQGPSAYVEVAGVKVDQPIAISATGTPVWAVLVSDNQLAAMSKDAAYLGKGLDEVKVSNPTIYNTLVVKQVQTVDGKVETRPMSAFTGVGEKVVATEISIQTFSGFDPKTGMVEGAKAMAGKVVVK